MLEAKSNPPTPKKHNPSWRVESSSSSSSTTFQDSRVVTVCDKATSISPKRRDTFTRSRSPSSPEQKSDAAEQSLLRGKHNRSRELRHRRRDRHHHRDREQEKESNGTKQASWDKEPVCNIM